MSRKRNTKYSETKLSVLSDILVTLLCITLSGYSLYLFTQQLNRTLKKNNEQPIAKITYKRKTAQRKFSDRAVWDRLQQESSVYDQDTIRTAPLSEATIWFDDGSTMELEENTLAVVYSKESRNGVSLKTGNVSLSSSEKGMLFDSGSATVAVNADTRMAASNDKDKGLSVQVEKGNVSYNQNGKTREMQEGSVSVNGKVPLISVVSPKLEKTILNQEGADVEVPFQWNAPDLPEDDSLVLELSSSRDFNSSTVQDLKGLEKTVVKLENGSWYWRMYPETEGKQSESAVSGKIKVLDAPPPKIIAPVRNYEYKYRTQKPVIRFLWVGNSYTAAYNLEIADNPDMQNPVVTRNTSIQSALVSELANGTWYWRVVPQYIMNKIQDGNPSAVSSFTISKKQAFSAPVLQVPLDDGTVNTVQGKDAVFSWKDDNEAVSYTITISDKKDISNPVIKETVTNNYLKIQNAGTVLTNGTWYWNVYQTDEEGNKSPLSETRAFLALDNNVVFKTLFPTDNYNLAVNRCYDTKFSWKSNLPFDSVLQISTDENFVSPEYEFLTTETNLDKIKLPEGTWYWRIVIHSEALTMQTEPKILHILPLLDKAVIMEPIPGGKIVVRPEATNYYEWKPVSGADYYQFRIYRNSIDSDPVYENVMLAEPKLSIDMTDLPEGKYIVSIQAFSDETATSSRRTGIPALYTFYVRMIHPVKLVAPSRSSVIPGETALLQPTEFEWNSYETPYYTSLVLKKGGKVITELKNPDFKQQIQLTEAGKYTWTIHADTFDDYDMSPLRSGFFEVSPVPPLDSPEIQEPKGKIDIEYLKKHKAIDFIWGSVDKANAYKFNILDSERNVIYATEIKSDASQAAEKQSCKFENLKILKKGILYWNVTAERYVNDDILFSKSRTLTTKIEIDLPTLKAPHSVNTGDLYGK